MSQIVDFDDAELEMLNLFARHLHPLLREEEEEEDSLDLGGVQLTHYRLQKQREQDLMLNDAKGETGLHPGGEFGTGKSRDKELEPLSRITANMYLPNAPAGRSRWTAGATGKSITSFHEL